MHPRRSPKFHAVVLLGLPGSGKGTQASRLAEVLGVPAISTGDILRRESVSGSPLGESVRALIESGHLVGDELVNALIVKRLSSNDCSVGFLLDGYPRTVCQAQFLEDWLASRGLRAPLVVYLDISAGEVATRLSRRLGCPTCGRSFSSVDSVTVCDRDGSLLVHRADDTLEAVEERFRQYERKTKPLLKHYSARIRYVRAGGPPAEVAAELLTAIRGYFKSYRHKTAAAVSRLALA
jgi:adenylate kinase